MGLIGSYLGTIACGGSGYHMSPFQFIKDPSCWIRALGRYGGTHTQAPNFAFALVARKWRGGGGGLSRGGGPTTRAGSDAAVRLDSVRHMLNAAEPVDSASIEAFEAAFCGETTHGLRRGVVFPTCVRAWEGSCTIMHDGG
jgi:acyl-CoA synthetase (AMP-forming)/AMP-acid ligase II